MKNYNLWREKIEKTVKEASNIQDFYKRVIKYDNLKKKARQDLQEIVNNLAKHFKTTHPPVYLSSKYKIKKRGLYFQKKRTGSIVLFPIRSYKFYSNGEKPELWVLSWEEVISTLRHELAHHLSRKNPGHGQDFQKALTKINRLAI